MCNMLNTCELQWYLHPHGDGGTVVMGVGGPVEQQVQFKKKFLNLFHINQLPVRAINIV